MSSFVTAGGDIGNGELLAQNAKDTANDANSGITDINDPNKLGPAEKATLKRKYDTDVLLYGMDTKKLTDNHLSTSEIDSAMSALTAYMTPFFANMSTTDTVNRDALNTVYKNFDTADKNADSVFTNMVSSAASDAMVAGNQASVAGSEAVVAGNQARKAASNAAVQASVAVSNANVANSNATSGITIARSAANDAEVVSEAVTALKGGSTLTLAQLENGLRTKISTSDADTLVDTKTDSLAEIMVKNSDFATYKDQTATAISAEINKAVSPNIVPEDGWRTSPDGAGSPSKITTHPFYTGSQPLYELDNNSTVENYAYSPRFSLKPNTTYVLSFKGFENVHVSSMDMFVLARKKGETSSYSSVYQVVSGKVLSPTTAEYVTTISFTTATDINSGYIRIDNNGSKDGSNGDVFFTEVQMQEGTAVTPYQTPTNDLVSSKIIQTIDNYSVGFKNSNGSTFQMNLSADGTALMDFSKIMLNGATNIQDATIGTAQIADAAITNAKIGKLAVGTAQIADLAVTSAKVSELDASLLKSGIIDTNRLNADAIIANVINGKTINGITINTPTLSLGLNGTLTTDFDISQPTSFYAPKKGTGTLSIKTGIINTNSQNMSRYSSTVAYWYGFDDNGNMVKNGTNPTVDDYAPAYEKHDIMKSTGAVLNRSYLDAMGLMFTEGGKKYNTMLTGVGLETAAALLHEDLTTDGTFKAALGTTNTYGFSIGNHVIAPMIQANSYTYAANMFISSYGTMGSSTSTKVNKLDIVDVPDMLQKGYNLLTLNPRQWFDKTSVEAYADIQAGNTDSVESVVDIKPVSGMVAEEVASAGLDDYVIKDENNKVQGLAYDRLWTLLLPVLRDMNDKINKLQKKEGI